MGESKGTYDEVEGRVIIGAGRDETSYRVPEVEVVLGS
jgi:hypothetical protein